METFIRSADGDFTSWNALEFIGADIEPDRGMYLAKWNSYIMALKAYSCQFYYDAANATNSIEPLPKTWRFGWVVHPPIRSRKWRVPWRGSADQGRAGRSIYLMTPQGPQAISTPPSVDRVLTHDDWHPSIRGCQDRQHVLYGITLGFSGVTLSMTSPRRCGATFRIWREARITRLSRQYRRMAKPLGAFTRHAFKQEIVRNCRSGDFSGSGRRGVTGTDTFKVGTTGGHFLDMPSCKTILRTFLSLPANIGGAESMGRQMSGRLF